MPVPAGLASWTRRRWLLAACAGVLLAGRGAIGATTVDLDAIRKKAKDVGLGPLGITENESYLAIGDAPERFRSQAVAICKDLSRAYLDHARAKKFPAEAPKARLVIVTLAGPGSFEKFTGETLAGPVGGHYDRDRNYLVMFDFRDDPSKDSSVAVRSNRLTLVHEATHQLTFNTGLLNLDGDVPASICEGLAIYAEPWAENMKKGFGGPNSGRKDGLIQELQGGRTWIPIEALLAKDDPLQDGPARQLAYSESWYLVQALMKPPRLAMFQNYLAAIRPRRDATKRVADAVASFGDLDKLDAEVRKLAGVRSGGRRR